MGWYKNAVFYEVYIRAFADGNGDGHGDFRGLTEKLDYFQKLGVDCLWLLPMYPSPLRDDGYDVSDFYGIHPDYGTLEDFKAFLAAAHARGLRVIADLVLNQGVDGLPLEKALENYRHAVEAGLLKIMSKMGISTLTSYRGAQIFEAIGLGPEVIETCFVGTPSRVGGIGLREFGEDAL
ncbi:MAG: hypothetical protein C4309_07860, partial [Chloroflexota bacterium]